MLVLLSSSTSAQRLKKFLATEHISASMVQTPKALSSGGCGYSLRLNGNHYEAVLRAAEKLHLRIKAIYDEVGEPSARQYRKKETL